MPNCNMSDPTKSNPSEALLPKMFENQARMVGDATRQGLEILTLPLNLFPQTFRNHLRQALSEAALALLVIPKEMTKSTQHALDQVFQDNKAFEPTPMPRADLLLKSARSLAEQVAHSIQKR